MNDGRREVGFRVQSGESGIDDGHQIVADGAVPMIMHICKLYFMLVVQSGIRHCSDVTVVRCGVQELRALPASILALMTTRTTTALFDHNSA